MCMPEIDKEQVTEEFHDILNLIFEDIKKNRGIVIKLCEEGDRICSRGNIIIVPKKCQDNIYSQLFNFEFEKTFMSITSKYKIKETQTYLKTCIYLFSLLYASFHEIGHIVQGHILYTGDDLIKKSWLEYDADMYAISLMCYLFNKKPDINVYFQSNDAIRFIFLISICFLDYFKLSNLKSEDYPPFEARVISTLLGFNCISKQNYTLFLNKIKEEMNITLEITDEDVALLNEVREIITDDFKQINYCFDFNISNFTTWYTEHFEKMRLFLDEIHNKAKE